MKTPRPRAGPGFVERLFGTDRPRVADGLFAAVLALGLRLAVVAYGAQRFPPADDGVFYEVVARRILEGHGYTWLWPDGAVTYAAHYPVGYPALMAVSYGLAGATPAAAMVMNAVFGAVATFAVHQLAAHVATRRGALFAALAAAVVPGLVLYTPALMTEAVAGSLLVAAAAVACAAVPASPAVRAVLAGCLSGVTVLVRPQLVLVVPAVGMLLGARERWGFRGRLAGALGVTAIAVATCLPWTARNCVRLERCAFVSVNGGWNLYIGSSPLGRGGWAPIEQIGVPAECRTVFDEAGKDECFGRAGARRIASGPAAWLGLVPAKLGATFNFGTASAHYLSASNPTLVGQAQKTAIGALELLGQRLLLIAAVTAAALGRGPRRRLRISLAALAVAAALSPWGYLGWLGLAGTLAALGRRLLTHPPALLALVSVAATALTHAVFFGASRYALVCLPALAALAGSLAGRSED